MIAKATIGSRPIINNGLRILVSRSVFVGMTVNIVNLLSDVVMTLCSIYRLGAVAKCL